MLWLVALASWPTDLEHADRHAHLVSLTWSHGQLHVVLQHQGPAGPVLDPIVSHVANTESAHTHHHPADTRHDTDHVIHNCSAPAALHTKTNGSALALLVPPAAGTWTAVTRPRPVLWPPPSRDGSHTLAQLRTTVLVV